DVFSQWGCLAAGTVTYPDGRARVLAGSRGDCRRGTPSCLLSFDWLRAAEREHRGAGVLVMSASVMRRNRPLLGSAPWDIVSRRTHRPRGRGPILAIWPSAPTLEL